MKIKYTKEFLEPLVKEATNWSRLIEAIGIPVSGGNHRTVKAAVLRWSIDYSHFTRQRKEWSYAKEDLSTAISKSKSWYAVLRDLGLEPTGTNNNMIRKLAKEYELNNNHFTGKSWNKGLTVDDHPSIRAYTDKISIPDSEVFKANGHPIKGADIAKRLVRDHGWKYKCSECGLTEWQGKPLSLDLDHVDGDNTNNCFENLRFLCPNCHRQTSTWGVKNRKVVHQIGVEPIVSPL